MQIIAFLVTILVLVSIHEAGHMVVARVLGIKVLRYSIGFGKALWRRESKKSGVEYVIAMIPLGGYVKLLDEREASVPDNEKHRAFNRQPLWSRTAVVAAGPVTNIIFAVVAYWLMFSVGVEMVKPVVGTVTPNSVAAVAGIQSGDLVTQVDGNDINNWEDVILTVVGRMGGSGVMSVKTQSQSGDVEQHNIALSQWAVDPLIPQPLQSLGIEPYHPELPAVVNTVKPGSPAAKAGILPNDMFIAIDGAPIKDWYALVKTVQPHPGKTFQFTLDRGGEKRVVAITAESQLYLRGLQRLGVIGVSVKPTEFPKGMKFEQKYSPLHAFIPAVTQTWKFFDFNFVVLKKIFKGEISLKTLGGPISIFNTADRAFKAGLVVFLNFLALMSVMLAFVNVLPIPGLDGGHILYFMIEFITRRPLSPAVEILTMRLGLIFLLLLTVAVSYNDIARLLQ